eukprot:2737200-Rhodomonas_salina.1
MLGLRRSGMPVEGHLPPALHHLFLLCFQIPTDPVPDYRPCRDGHGNSNSDGGSSVHPDDGVSCE